MDEKRVGKIEISKMDVPPLPISRSEEPEKEIRGFKYHFLFLLSLFVPIPCWRVRYTHRPYVSDMMSKLDALSRSGCMGGKPFLDRNWPKDIHNQ